MFAKNANSYYETSNTVQLFFVKYFSLSVSTFVIIIDFIIYYLLQITCVLHRFKLSISIYEFASICRNVEWTSSR